MWWDRKIDEIDGCDEIDEIYEFGHGCLSKDGLWCNSPGADVWLCILVQSLQVLADLAERFEEPLFAWWWWWCLEFWNLMIWIWLSDIEKHYALFCAADKALSCTPQTNQSCLYLLRMRSFVHTMSRCAVSSHAPPVLRCSASFTAMRCTTLCAHVCV